jgi:hypothetical protein
MAVVVAAAWWEPLIGVLIGAAVTLATTFGLEAWRTRLRAEEVAQSREEALRQALRLVLVELDEIDGAIREAASVGAYWTERMAGRELPTGTWNTYREVLAVRLDPHPWRLVAAAFDVANDLNWRLRAGKLARPPESQALRIVWRTVRAAINELEPLVGRHGEYEPGTSHEYPEEFSIEEIVFGTDQVDLPTP